MSSPLDGPSPADLHKPVARLLRPLVRLFIKAGVTFPALSDLLRELYVNVAEHDFALDGKGQTDSRVSLLTGIHRKEVARLRGAGAPVSEVPSAVSRTSLILARWLADKTFTDRQGRPLRLPRVAPPRRPSFEGLVASVTQDVRARAVLDEWIDRKIVTLDREDRVVLLETAYLPGDGDSQQLYYFGRNLADHIGASIANITQVPAPFLERAVHYDGLSADLARELQARSRDWAMEALQAANREAHGAVGDDAGGRYRWIFGTYVFVEEEPEAETANDPA